MITDKHVGCWEKVHVCHICWMFADVSCCNSWLMFAEIRLIHAECWEIRNRMCWLEVGSMYAILLNEVWVKIAVMVVVVSFQVSVQNYLVVSSVFIDQFLSYSRRKLIVFPLHSLPQWRRPWIHWRGELLKWRKHRTFDNWYWFPKPFWDSKSCWIIWQDFEISSSCFCGILDKAETVPSSYGWSCKGISEAELYASSSMEIPCLFTS